MEFHPQKANKTILLYLWRPEKTRLIKKWDAVPVKAALVQLLPPGRSQVPAEVAPEVLVTCLAAAIG